MYTWSKNKFPCDLFPKWLYTLVRKLKIAKKLHCKRCLAYLHGNIYWCPKGHMKKSDNFRKPLVIITNLFLLCELSGIKRYSKLLAMSYINCRQYLVIHKWSNILPKWQFTWMTLFSSDLPKYWYFHWSRPVQSMSLTWKLQSGMKLNNCYFN